MAKAAPIRSTPAQSWCFTLNNYTEEEFAGLSFWSCRYLIVGKEMGENKTPHLQGYVEFYSKKRLSGCKALSYRAHWEKRNGRRDQARDYCKKSNDFVEFGTWAETLGQGYRSDLKDVVQASKENRSFVQALGSCPSLTRYVHCFKLIRSELDKEEAPHWRDVSVSLFVGKTGTGKTRLAMDHKSVYKLDMANNLWFDGYDRETRLVIDDFYGWIKYGHLLQLLDGYRMRLEIKGSFTYAYWTEVIITSNKMYNEWYKDRDLSALERRITTVKNFDI